MKPLRISLLLSIAVLAPAHTFGNPGMPDTSLQAYAGWIYGATKESILGNVRHQVHQQLTNAKQTTDTAPIAWAGSPVGIFVTAMKDRTVRSCVGTIYPRAESFSEELVRQTRRVTASDPRHPPLSVHELDGIEFVVTLTGHPQSVSDPNRVDIFQDGLLAEWDGRAAVLLPGEAKTLAWGIGYLRKQLGIPPSQLPSYSIIPVLVIREKKNER